MADRELGVMGLLAVPQDEVFTPYSRRTHWALTFYNGRLSKLPSNTSNQVSAERPCRRGPHSFTSRAGG